MKRKIQSIEPQKRRKNRFTIIFESGDVFGISEDVFLSIPLKIGQTLDSEEYDKIQILESSARIKNQTLILLSYRQRSRAELTKRLKEKDHSFTIIEGVLNDLETKGYINDSDFAKMYATHLVEKKMVGKIAVRNEFYKHQIPDSILDPILDDLYESHPPSEIVQYIISKRMNTRKKTEKEKTRLINLLKRKGFTWDEMESEIKGMNWDD